jgi:hypothetical protein
MTQNTCSATSLIIKPLNKGNPEYVESSWNLQVNCDYGCESWKPHHILAEDSPITITYDIGLLHQPRWKQFNC